MTELVGEPPSTSIPARQTAWGFGGFAWLGEGLERVERVLEAERQQLPLWLPVALGLGVAGWFVLPVREGWFAPMLGGLAVAALGLGVGRMRRLGVALIWFGLFVSLGVALAWARADWVAAPVLKRPVVAGFEGEVERVQRLAARDVVRVTLAPVDVPALPPRVRVNIAQGDAPEGLAKGDRLRLRARLMPPSDAALPGAYDFARYAWFEGIGATGRAFAPVERVSGGGEGAGMRERLSAHIQSRLAGGEGAIATALATGDQGAISEADAEAMRRSGLAHLLSVSGLHITAVVGATMLLVLRLLALSPALALRWPLLLIAGAAGAAAGVGYTLLTGAEVPTVRACIAALLVLGGLALGRDAITLRVVAAGALVVLLLWPEALVGPSFQLSFAAVTAIVALHEHPRAKALLSRRDEGWAARAGRFGLGLLLTGLAVEAALAPIALFHFHKAGLFGALANIVAIPLTTFVIMPLEALALLLDVAGLGAPVWWLTGKALGLLLWIAHNVADAPGAVASLASMPRGAYALMIGGGLWICLWRTRMRRLGLAPFALGAAWALATPPPDLLVTGDGRHVAVRGERGEIALLRPRAGDYVRDMLAENAGVDGELGELDALPGARCGPDSCIAELERGGRRWRVLATRSPYHMPIRSIVRACREADIVISDRRLPRTCAPKWLKLDRVALGRTGGVAIDLGSGRFASTRRPGDDHPWR